MKHLRIFLIFLLYLAVFKKAQSQVNKIEHFFASSPKAEKLFQFFSKELELPVGMSSDWNVLMRFTIDNNKLITGFDLQHTRLMHHRFDKVN